MPAALAEIVRRGGSLVMGSAAAVTVGSASLPVYEIYKVGDEPRWLDGLDMLSVIDLDVAVIPHYDNSEGGHHDTRFCYLGEKRLAMLEDELPASAHVIGVDEHTGLIIDIDAGTATVIGNGTVTVRIRGASTVYESGRVLPVDALRDPARGSVSVSSAPSAPIGRDADASSTDASGGSLSLADDVAGAESEFDIALAAGDSARAVRATLDLETSIRNWSADTLQSDAMDRAHAALRSMIVRLGDAAVKGLADPRDALAPVMNVLIELRGAVRADKRYDLSDLIRDRLGAIGIEVRDTPDGPVWVL